MNNPSNPILKSLKIVAALIALSFVVILGWLSLSLVWYPSYDEIDQQTLTKEADILLARCKENPIRSGEDGDYILNVESQTPYIYSLVRNKERHQCAEGVSLLLWDDYLVSSAGVYVVGENSEVPIELQPFASHLAGRVYKWHAGSQF
jgi:biotin transporter BioY